MKANIWVLTIAGTDSGWVRLLFSERWQPQPFFKPSGRECEEFHFNVRKLFCKTDSASEILLLLTTQTLWYRGAPAQSRNYTLDYFVVSFQSRYNRIQNDKMPLPQHFRDKLQSHVVKTFSWKKKIMKTQYWYHTGTRRLLQQYVPKGFPLILYSLAFIKMWLKSLHYTFTILQLKSQL